MRTFRIGSAVHALAIIAAVTAIPSHAQTVQAALSKEAGTLSDKFTGLARVMAGKYDWKPGLCIIQVLGDSYGAGTSASSYYWVTKIIF